MESVCYHKDTLLVTKVSTQLTYIGQFTVFLLKMLASSEIISGLIQLRQNQDSIVPWHGKLDHMTKKKHYA